MNGDLSKAISRLEKRIEFLEGFSERSIERDQELLGQIDELAKIIKLLVSKLS